MSNELAKEWLQSKWPNMRGCDVEWTMKRYDYPDYVCDYIKNNWVKISNDNGGVYHKPTYNKKSLNDNQKKEQEEEEEKADDGKEMAKIYQQTGFAKGMDENNKKALDVMAKEGMDAAAKHMMSNAGGDYARMRSMYG